MCRYLTQYLIVGPKSFFFFFFLQNIFFILYHLFNKHKKTLCGHLYSLHPKDVYVWLLFY